MTPPSNLLSGSPPLQRLIVLLSGILYAKKIRKEKHMVRSHIPLTGTVRLVSFLPMSDHTSLIIIILFTKNLFI